LAVKRLSSTIGIDQSIAKILLEAAEGNEQVALDSFYKNDARASQQMEDEEFFGNLAKKDEVE